MIPLGTTKPPHRKMTSASHIANADRVPVLADAGALVVEGTLAGCVAAWLLARGGCKTVLAVSGCSLPQEIVVARRPWTRASEWSSLPPSFQEIWQGCMGPAGRLLNLSKLAAGVEDLLLDAGVRLFYGLTPCGAEVARKGHPTGVVFGGKAGLQLIRAGRIVDCTAVATVAGLAGVPLRRRILTGGRVAVHLGAKVGLFDRSGPMVIARGQTSGEHIKPIDEPSLTVPGVPELISGRIALHGPYAEISLRLPVDLDDPFWPAKLSVAARESLVRIGERANKRRAGRGKAALHFHRFSGCLLTAPLVRARGSGASNPYRVPGGAHLWVCGPAADVGDPEARRLADPYRAARAASHVAEEILAARPPRPRASKLLLANPAHAERAEAAGSFHFADAASLHATQTISIPRGLVLPVLAEADVLVVGAGTSGVPAALASAGCGSHTILLDQHGDVGGTRTIGGVGSYWFGRETPFQKACDQAYDRITARSGVAEELAMLRCLLDAGVTLLAPCAVVGVIRQGRQVDGVVVATARGLGVVKARVFVDTTGDADLAAWAGAPFEYGSGRDAMTLWASFGNFNHEKRTANRQYESSLEVRDPWDFTRAIVRARRRPGMWHRLEHEMPQHYVTPRESRRIVADATVTYGGILAGETFPDVMMVCESNFDIKGVASSDLNACGVVSSWDVYDRFQAAVPYRAILPRGISNLLVAGRAYSASHDAISLARMQRDMVSLGGAAGVAAAWSAKSGTPAAGLDVEALQKEWVRRGMLRADDRARFGKRACGYTAREARLDCQRLAAGRGRSSFLMSRLMRSRASLGPLRHAFASATRETVKTRFARALCCLGDRRAVNYLIRGIERQTCKKLPRIREKNLAVPPEHGWAPEPVYSLRAIGLAGAGATTIPAMTAIASKIEDHAERFGSKTDSQFEYVLGICAVAERCPGRQMIAPLEVLLAKRSLRNLALPWERDMRFTEDPVLERRAYLEMCIGRALARCADPRGFQILLRYTDDLRGALARSASDELADLLGRALPGDRAPRRRLVERHISAARPKPFTKRIG